MFVKVSSNGTTVVYTCDNSYLLNDVSQRTCSENGGGWSDTPPTCGKYDYLSRFPHMVNSCVCQSVI